MSPVDIIQFILIGSTALIAGLAFSFIRFCQDEDTLIFVLLCKHLGVDAKKLYALAREANKKDEEKENETT